MESLNGQMEGFSRGCGFKVNNMDRGSILALEVFNELQSGNTVNALNG